MTQPKSELSLFNQSGLTPSLPDRESITELFKRIADFQAKAHGKPDPKFVEKTPDGRADALVISYVENRLDELYSGLWSTVEWKYQVITNELTGSIVLKVFHPECGVWLERCGTASIKIMMDAAPVGVDKNAWAMDINNKKPNALTMNLPTLKAECIKNAAKSLGITFGRELNRKKSDTNYNPTVYDEDSIELRQEIELLCDTATLPAAELEVMRRYAADATMPYTRLEGIKDRLTSNQK